MRRRGDSPAATGPIVLDPLLSDAEADEVVRIWHEFGSYGQYSNEGFPTQLAPELPQRYDARENFVRSGGRFRRDEDRGLLGARTNYFRETYAYGDEVFAPGVEILLQAEALLDAARRLHGRPMIVPSIVYANILLPGQELAVHTDVPEFRGANRTVVPQWLLVVMRHSGLFERWRMPIATAVTYFGRAKGGALAWYDGDEPRTYEPRHNTAAVLDTDSIFHGVDRVEGDDSILRDVRSGQRLFHDGGGAWSLRSGDRVIAKVTTDDLRYSASWKAYCFADDAEREAWESHTDDLTLDVILATLLDDLGVDRPDSDVDLGKLLIDRYITFPS
ncbi:MAG: hypothetical protein QOD30_1683 [Actinomycetota bacterium]|jgi:hypothetical protein|nr:hypothetical protein [Actinomycetota bacterium]